MTTMPLSLSPRKPILFFFCGLLIADHAFAVGDALTATKATETKLAPGFALGVDPHKIVSRDDSQRIWEQVKYLTNFNLPIPRVEIITNRYTELGAGICFQQPDGKWADSQPRFVLAGDGSVEATEIPHKVRISPDLYSIAAVKMTLPDGRLMSSTFRGLYLYDTSTEKRLIVSEITNSVGTLVSSNILVYSNCFANLKGDLVLKVTPAGLAQDVVIRESLAWIPFDEISFDPKSTVLEAWTEFYEVPAPDKQTNTLPARTVAEGPANALSDESLKFGDVVMVPGRAYLSETTNGSVRLNAPAPTRDSVPVGKTWIEQDNRRFLIERLRWPEILPQFKRLETNSAATVDTASASPSRRLRSVPADFTPPKLLAASTTTTNRTTLLAQSSLRDSPAFIFDYTTVTCSGGICNGYRFAPTETYYVSSPITINNDVVFCGGTVIKIAPWLPGSSISINGTAHFETGPSRMVLVTGRDDDSVGQRISTSTGSLDIGYGYPALDFGYSAAPVNVDYLRVSWAVQAIYFQNGSGTLNKIQHSQFVNAYSGVVCSDNNLVAHNVLFANVDTAFEGIFCQITAEHLTVHRAFLLASDWWEGSFLTLINSILVEVGDCWMNSSLPDTVVWLPPEEYPFQTSVLGAYYLSENSAYRGVGTPEIDSELKEAFKEKTTHPPLPLPSGQAGAVMNQRVWRNIAPFDLGFAYDALDYAGGACQIETGTLLITNGVVVGFDAGAGSPGVYVLPDVDIVSEGSPLKRNRLLEVRSVQEQHGAAVSVFTTLHQAFGGPSHVRLRFTDFIGRAGINWHIYRDNGVGSMALTDCQMFDGGIGGSPGWSQEHTIGLTNNLFEYCNLSIVGTTSTHFDAFNNTFTNCSINLSGGGFSWSVRDNLFLSCSLGASPPVGNGYNGYWNTYPLPSSGPTYTLTAQPNYQSGPLGNWYLVPGSSQLFNGGSRSPAAAALFHHTTRVSQTKEGSKAPGVNVDVGFHYVALNSRGLEVDTDGDGVSDVREDVNSNNQFDPGETDLHNPCFEKMDVVLLMDASQSLSLESFGQEKLSAEVFISKLRISGLANPPKDRVGVISFNAVPTTVASLGAAVGQVLPKIHAMERALGTQFHDPITAAHQMLDSSGNAGARRAIVLMTDGKVGTQLYKDLALWAAHDAKVAGIKVYTIGFDDEIDANLLKGIASTDQDFFGPENQSGVVDAWRLNEFLDRIVRDLCRGNGKPFVEAGAEQTVWLPEVAHLNGVAYDTDNNPPAVNLVIGWNKESGPGPVSFAPDPSDPNNRRKAIASFSVRGDYVLRLSASDTLSAASDTVTIHVEKENSLPVVNAGPDQTIEFPNRVYLPGRVTDDGQPNGTLTVSWSKVSGPGTVTFDDTSKSETTAAFSLNGTYVLRLRGNDGTPDVFCDAGQTAPGVCDDVVVQVKNRPDIEVFKNVDYVSAGVGMRPEPGTGFYEAGAGTITLSGIAGSVKRAYLYWNGPIDVANPNANAEVLVNGRFVVGVNIGVAHNNCWVYNDSGLHFHSYASSHSYRADVTPIVLATGNGSYTLQSFYKTTEININGASLVAVFENEDDQQNGDLLLYQGNDSNLYKTFGANGPVYALAVQADGKVIIGGDFTAVGGIPRARIARVRPDGEVDHQFLPFPGVNGAVRGIAVQANGRIVIGGEFTEVNGQPRYHIAQLESNGALGAGFNQNINGVINSIMQQVPSGEIYIGGAFSLVGGNSRRGIARFTSAGTLDGFDPELDHNTVNAVALETNGPALISVLVAGSYLDGQQIRGKVSRVAPGGAVGSFDPVLNEAVYAIRVQQNGKVLIGGAFTEVDGDPRPRIARLLASGELDTAFMLSQPPDNTVFAIERYYDPNAESEQILIGGAFTHMGVAERRGLAEMTEGGNFVASPDLLIGSVHTLVLKDAPASSSVYAGGAFYESGVMANMCLYHPGFTADTTFLPSDWHWGQVFPPFVYSGASPAPTLQLHVSDGQPPPGHSDDAVYFNEELLLPAGDNFQGALGDFWDILPFSVGAPFITPGFNQPVLRTGAWEEDCFSLVAAILKLPPQSVPPPPTPPVPRPPWESPVAREDAVTVPRELGAAIIHALANDTSADGFPMRITAITSPDPDAGVAQIVYEGTAILFTPNYSIDPHPTEATFSYTVVDHNGYSASANVTLTFTGGFAVPLNSPVDLVPLASYQSVVSDTLTDDDPNDKTSLIRGGNQRAHYYRFAAAEGDTVTISISSDEAVSGLPTHVYIRDPLGRVVASSSHIYRFQITPGVPPTVYDYSSYIERVEHKGIYTVEVASHAPNPSPGGNDWGTYQLTFNYQVQPEESELIVINNGIKVTAGDLIDMGNERTKNILVRNIGKNEAGKPTSVSLPSGSAFTVTPNRLGAIPSGQTRILTVSVKDIAPGDKVALLHFVKDGDPYNPDPAWDFTVKLHANTSVPPGSKNSAPMLKDDKFVVYENTESTTIINPCDVLANDSDPDGDPLKIIKITQGAFGEVKTNSAGTLITYKPNQNRFGTDIFQYTVYDGRGAKSTATVFVQIRARNVELLAPPPYDPDPQGNPPNAGQNVPVHITASTSDGEITHVAFFTNGVINFETNKGPYQFNWVPVAQGFYEIKAIAWDDRGEKLESEGRTVGIGLTGDHPATGRIDNLSEGQTVRDGLFAMHGTADDPDDLETSGPDDLTYTFILYELTPGIQPGQPWLRSIVPNFGVIYPGPGNPPPSNGKKVVDGPLGTLDFTRVPNGVYELEFRITQAAKSVFQNISFTLDSQAKIGQFTFSVTDLEITMGNIPFAIVRTYDSFNLKRGDFGVGWTMSMNNLEIRVDEDREWTPEDDVEDPEYLPMRVGGSRNVTLTLPDGRRTTFVFTLEPATGGESFAALAAKWIGPPGVYATLTPLDGDTLQFLPWQNVIGPMWSGAGPEVPWDNYDFRGYILTNSDGMRYDIVAESPGKITLPPVNTMQRWVRPYINPKLTTIRSRGGERIEIGPGSPGSGNVIVKHYQTPITGSESPTRTVAIERDSLGRVTKVFDPKHVNPDGTLIGSPEPALEYQYSDNGQPPSQLDPSANLTKVIKLVKVPEGQAPVKNTTTYQYEQPGHPHFITAILDGRRNNWVPSEEIPRLKAQADDKGRLAAFKDASNQELVNLEHNLLSQREIIKQPLSSTPGDSATAMVDYDTRGRVIRTVDPLGNATSRSYDDAGQVLVETDALGHTSTYEYDPYGHRRATVDANGGLATVEHNRFGQMEKLRDPRVNALYPDKTTVSNTYDPTTGNLLKSRDINEHLQSDNSYTSRNLIQNVVNVMGTITKHDYYSIEAGGRPGDLKRVYTTDPAGNVLSSTTYTWDGIGNRLTQTQKRTVGGAEQLTTMTYVYDEQNRPIETRDPLNNLGRTEYNLAGKPLSTFDKLGRETKYLYDARYNVIQITHPSDATDSRILVERTVYDAQNRPIFKQDRAECAGWPYGGTVAHGTRYVYDEAGRLIQTERVSNLTIDILAENGEDIIWPEPRVGTYGVVSFTTTIYDGVGRVIQTVDARGFSTFYAYDAAGRRTHVTNALGQVTAFGYDENGNQTSMTDGLGRTTEYIYDELNRRTGVKQPLLENQNQHSYLLTQYDKLGQRVAETNQDTIITRYLYDRLGRLIAVTNADGTPDRLETRYGYDEQHLIQQTNAAGHVTTFGYNELGQRVWRALPDGKTERFFYDPVGNMTKRTNLYQTATHNGVMHFEYDVHNLLRKKIDPTQDPDLPPLAEFSYYPNGLRHVVSDTSHRIHPPDESIPAYREGTFYGYDTHNRLSVKDVTNALGSHTFQYEYDLNGNLKRLLLINRHAARYEWDALNRLTNVMADGVVNHAISGWPRENTSYKYDPAGNLEECEYLTGVKTTCGHDGWNRLRSVTSTLGATPIASFAYTLLSRGNRETLTENIQGRRRAVTYSYDKLDRLTQETIGGIDPQDPNPSPAGAITYDSSPGYNDAGGFDKNSNRRSRTDTLEPQYFPYPDQSFVYDSRDRLNSDLYDDDGNSLGPVGTPEIYQDKYDLEHRLVQRTRDEVIGGIPYRHVIELAYDADGYRVRKSNLFYDMSNPQAPAFMWGMSPTIYYFIDDLNPTGYAQVIGEAGYIGLGIVVPELTRTYEYGLDLISQKLGNDSAIYFYGYDGHGSVRYLTKGDTVWVNGQQVLDVKVTDTYTYDAFGVLLDQRALNGGQLVLVGGGIEGTPNYYFFAGEQWDSDLKLYYLRARYQNPNTGRFWTQDNFEGHQTEPLSLHRYLYAQNNPVMMVDPSGEEGNYIALMTSSTISASLSAMHNGVVAGIGSAMQATVFGVQAGQSMNEILTGFILDETGIGLAIDGYNMVKSFFQDDEEAELAAFMAWKEQLIAMIIAAMEDDEFGEITVELVPQCFVAGTPVAIETGLKPIEEIKIGDKVWAWNESRDEVMLRAVLNRFVHRRDEIFEIQVGRDTLKVTGEHPFYVSGKGWTATRDIQVGDLLVTDDNESLAAERVEKQQGQFLVYNFEVSTDHSYYVGEEGILTHNISALRKAMRLTNPLLAAHHIVALRAKGAAGARALLLAPGTGIVNLGDIRNGIALPRNLKVRVPGYARATVHSVVHTKKYYTELENRLALAAPGQRIQVLQQAAHELRIGKFPY